MVNKRPVCEHGRAYIVKEVCELLEITRATLRKFRIQGFIYASNPASKYRSVYMGEEIELCWDRKMKDGRYLYQKDEI